VRLETQNSEVINVARGSSLVNALGFQKRGSVVTVYRNFQKIPSTGIEVSVIRGPFSVKYAESNVI
jgi:hypothetical protein